MGNPAHFHFDLSTNGEANKLVGNRITYKKGKSRGAVTGTKTLSYGRFLQKKIKKGKRKGSHGLHREAQMVLRQDPGGFPARGRFGYGAVVPSTGRKSTKIYWILQG